VVKPYHPLTIAVVVTLIGAVALLACYLPALRAARQSDDCAARGIERQPLPDCMRSAMS
jgi:hypothetical protein